MPPDADMLSQVLEWVYEEAQAESDRHESDDMLNDPGTWVTLISKHATKWRGESRGNLMDQFTVDKFQRQIVKVAALAVSAIESLRRQREENGFAFYEVPPPPDEEIPF